jgi:hypothetical protein
MSSLTKSTLEKIRSPSPVLKPKNRSMWVKCETPTTGRSYYIHRRTGKISWSDPTLQINQDKERSPKLISFREQVNPSPIQTRLSSPSSKKFNATPSFNIVVSTSADIGNVAVTSTKKTDTKVSKGTDIAKSPIKKAKSTTTNHVDVLTSTPTSTATSSTVNLTSFEMTNNRMRHFELFFKRWKHRGQLKVFTQWKLFVLYDRIHEQLSKEQRENKQLKTILKMTKAQGELDLERVQIESWKKAQKEKNISLKRYALRRLKKWMEHHRADLKHSFNIWVKQTNVSRMIQLNELISNKSNLKANEVELEALKQQYEMDQKEWKNRLSYQIELIAGLQNDVQMLQNHAKKTSEQSEIFENLKQKYTTEKTTWMRRFQMQQEMIERLEHDVEELSELKVLELAENYYDGT